MSDDAVGRSKRMKGVLLKPQVRVLVKVRKIPTGDVADWRQDAIPANASIFPKKRAAPAAGSWRCLNLIGGEREFHLLVLAQPLLDEMKAWLAVKSSDGWHVIARLEQHGDHPGLHVHDSCGAASVPYGPPSISSQPNRRPQARRHHRLKAALSKDEFYALALSRFRIKSFYTTQGALL